MELLAPGTKAGAYEVVEPLGRGGMGEVYRALDASLDREVALKVLPGEFLHDPTFSARFRREARLIARLEHRNIVPVYGRSACSGTGTPRCGSSVSSLSGEDKAVFWELKSRAAARGWPAR